MINEIDHMAMGKMKDFAGKNIKWWRAFTNGF